MSVAWWFLEEEGVTTYKHSSSTQPPQQYWTAPMSQIIPSLHATDVIIKETTTVRYYKFVGYS